MCAVPALLLIAQCAMAHAQITILPPEVKLSSSVARQRLLVQQEKDGITGSPVTAPILWTIANPEIATIEEGIVIPKKDGQTTITAMVDGVAAGIPLIVENAAVDHQVNFRNHVQSVFSKAGCNMGACHGATAGKGGFKLSLRGYDPEIDFLSITRQAKGRRIVPGDPGRSLILTKPTGTIPHKGGVRFDVGSPEYDVIATWLAQGYPGPSVSDPRIEQLEIFPKASRQEVGAIQQMVVMARFSDGHVEDVTRNVKYTATNHAVCSVDERGKVTVTGSGEGAIVGWYLAQNVTATVTVPQTTAVDPQVFAAARQDNLIDREIIAKLKTLNIPPSGLATDSEFLRRIYLDTIGVLPTVEETTQYLADTDPGKKTKLVDQLLSRSEFIDYWAYKWSDLLLISGERLRPDAIKAYYKWIREQVEQNVPWDKFVGKVVTAQGSTFENGAANFFALHQDPQDMSETVSMAFLGMSINCSKCHDHPLEKWTNDQYYGMASLFARVRGKGWGGDFRNGDGNRTIYLATSGELLQPRTGKPQPPAPLDGEPLAFDDPRDRREHLVKWLTSPENPYFTKAIVNRVWANFMGVGLVEAVDDLRLTNPPSNPVLFDALAAQMVAHQYDLKWLMREILLSEAYARSSHPVPGNEGDKRFYSHHYPRRLAAEVLLDAIANCTGVPTPFKDYPAGTRALQLPDAAVNSYFLETFGRPDRLLTCECERATETSMTQVLHLMNGQTFVEKLEHAEGKIAKQIAANTSTTEIVNDLYLSALSRLPTEKERAKFEAILGGASTEERRQVLEDLYWSVLSSREFLFQH